MRSHSLPHEKIYASFGDDLVMAFVNLTAGAKGRFSGGFDISGFGEIQKGTSMLLRICIFGDCIAVMYLM